MALSLKPDQPDEALTAEVPAVTPPAATAPAPRTAESPPAAPEGAPITLSVTLEGLFKDWLTQRARHHDQPPAEHAAAILRAYWAHHDTWRHQQGASQTRVVAP